MESLPDLSSQLAILSGIILMPQRFGNAGHDDSIVMVKCRRHRAWLVLTQPRAAFVGGKVIGKP